MCQHCPADDRHRVGIARRDSAAIPAGSQRAQGDWQDGGWADFDPLSLPHKIGAGKRQ
jgi:hypothetical protein